MTDNIKTALQKLAATLLAAFVFPGFGFGVFGFLYRREQESEQRKLTVIDSELFDCIDPRKWSPGNRLDIIGSLAGLIVGFIMWVMIVLPLF